MEIDLIQKKELLDTILLQHENRIQSHMEEDLKKSKVQYELLVDKKTNELFIQLRNKLNFLPEIAKRLHFSFSSAIECEKKPFQKKIYNNMRCIGIENFAKYLLNVEPFNLTPQLYIHAYYPNIERFFSKLIFGWKIVGKNLLIPLKIPGIINHITEASWIIITPYYVNFRDLWRLIKGDNRFDESDPHFTYQLGNLTDEEVKDFATHENIFLFEEIRDGESEPHFVPYGHGDTYQYKFQLEGLKKFRKELNPYHRLQKDFLFNITITHNGSEDPSYLPEVSSKFKWDSDQRQALSLLAQGKPFIVLNGFVGTGKTEVITSFFAQLKKKRAILLSHDHAVVEFLFRKYKEANPENIALRIGVQQKAKLSKYHIKAGMDEVRNDIMKNVQATLTKEDLSDGQADILNEWQSFLDRPEGLEILGKLKFNAANALFCTINGLEFYNKKGWLDEFLPFDYLLVDEASMTDLSMVLHATQFCKSNVIAGDPFLIPPRNKEWKNRQNVISDLEMIFGETKNHFMISFCTEYRMVEKLFNLLNTYVWKNPKAICRFNESSKFNVKNNGKLLDDSPITLIKSDNLGDKSREAFGSNIWESDALSQILEQLNEKTNWDCDLKGKIPKVWCTSLFGKQVDFLRRRNRVKTYTNLNVEISTVRAYSGDEADVVIWSVTQTPLINRKKQKKVIGNLDAIANPEYIYDLITRTKSKLIVVGSAEILSALAKKLQRSHQTTFSIKIGNLIAQLSSPKWVTIIEP